MANEEFINFLNVSIPQWFDYNINKSSKSGKQYAKVSIPQWFDYNFESHHEEVMGNESQFHNGSITTTKIYIYFLKAITSLNSTMVRLQLFNEYQKVVYTPGLNSTMVRLQH